nr:hypothetical protein [uncultured Undibacterium sp.]
MAFFIVLPVIKMAIRLVDPFYVGQGCDADHGFSLCPCMVGNEYDAFLANGGLLLDVSLFAATFHAV